MDLSRSLGRLDALAACSRTTAAASSPCRDLLGVPMPLLRSKHAVHFEPGSAVEISWASRCPCCIRVSCVMRAVSRSLGRLDALVIRCPTRSPRCPCYVFRAHPGRSTYISRDLLGASLPLFRGNAVAVGATSRSPERLDALLPTCPTAFHDRSVRRDLLGVPMPLLYISYAARSTIRVTVAVEISWASRCHCSLFLDRARGCRDLLGVSMPLLRAAKSRSPGRLDALAACPPAAAD
jgi:hypothetical protein